MPKIDISNRKSLKLLSIFHYIVGGIVAAISLFNLIFVSLGLSMIFSPQPPPQPNEVEFPSDEFKWIFFLGGLVSLLFGLTLAICLIASGRFLAKRKRYWFSFVVACTACLEIPLGTILGIFTIITLSQNSVKELYGLNNQD